MLLLLRALWTTTHHGERPRRPPTGFLVSGTQNAVCACSLRSSACLATRPLPSRPAPAPAAAAPAPPRRRECVSQKERPPPSPRAPRLPAVSLLSSPLAPSPPFRCSCSASAPNSSRPVARYAPRIPSQSTPRESVVLRARHWPVRPPAGVLCITLPTSSSHPYSLLARRSAKVHDDRLPLWNSSDHRYVIYPHVFTLGSRPSSTHPSNSVGRIPRIQLHVHTCLPLRSILARAGRQLHQSTSTNACLSPLQACLRHYLRSHLSPTTCLPTRALCACDSSLNPAKSVTLAIGPFPRASVSVDLPSTFFS